MKANPKSYNTVERHTAKILCETCKYKEQCPGFEYDEEFMTELCTNYVEN